MFPVRKESFRPSFHEIKYNTLFLLEKYCNFEHLRWKKINCKGLYLRLTASSGHVCVVESREFLTTFYYVYFYLTYLKIRIPRPPPPQKGEIS